MLLLRDFLLIWILSSLSVSTKEICVSLDIFNFNENLIEINIEILLTVALLFILKK